MGAVISESKSVRSLKIPNHKQRLKIGDAIRWTHVIDESQPDKKVYHYGLVQCINPLNGDPKTGWEILVRSPSSKGEEFDAYVYAYIRTVGNSDEIIILDVSKILIELQDLRYRNERLIDGVADLISGDYENMAFDPSSQY